jgi:putative acetyltransferase
MLYTKEGITENIKHHVLYGFKRLIIFMKIRKVTPENYARVSALLREAFPESIYEAKLIEDLHKNDRPVHEWLCIQNNRTVAYIAFTNAFVRAKICGLHLAPLAVNPRYQHQGIATELINYAMRQEAIKSNTIFVLGDPAFYQKFGFEHCDNPICPFDKDNAHFLSIRNNPIHKYTVGYEPEFNSLPGKINLQPHSEDCDYEFFDTEE